MVQVDRSGDIQNHAVGRYDFGWVFLIPCLGFDEFVFPFFAVTYNWERQLVYVDVNFQGKASKWRSALLFLELVSSVPWTIQD